MSPMKAGYNAKRAISAHPAPKMPIRGTSVRLVVKLTAAQVILRWNVQRGGDSPIGQGGTY